MSKWHVLALSSVLCWVGQASAQIGLPSGSRSVAASAQQAGGARASVERGRYLAEHVAMCVECHSGRDAEGGIVPAERYMGGPIPPGPTWATSWAMRAPRNKGLPGYTDELAIRLLTQGAINREGRQLQPPMPRFRMTEQDAADIAAFLKSLQ